MIRFIKDLLFKDLPLKLVSLALAIALWAVVASVIEKGKQERGVTMDSNKQFQGVPVAVVCSLGDATGYRVQPNEVTVFIQGTPEAIAKLQPASVRAQVDLSYWDSRENLPLPVRVIVPAGTAVVSCSPEEVHVIPPEPDPFSQPQS
jgi:YbbR domain-containing protein